MKNYIDVHEASAKWDMTERRITMLCRDGKIKGAKKQGKLWYIPEGAAKPFDGRTKEAHKSAQNKSRKGRTVMGKYFGTDGFRGKAGEVLTAEHAFLIGRFLGYYYGKERPAKIVIGKDTRRSSYMYENALSAGITSLIESVKKIIEPTEPSYTTPTLIVIIVAIGVKLMLGWFVKRKGKQLKSDALIASGSDALFDSIITTATLISAGILLIWHFSLDGILGALISVVIIKAGIEMLASPVNELLGARVSPDLVKDLKRTVLGVEGVHGVYDIILHNYGPDVMIGSLHVSVLDTLSAHDIHGLTRKLSNLLFEKYGIIMTVGIYALATGESRYAELQAKVIKALASNKEIVQVHGFYCSEEDRMLSVDVVPDISCHDDVALTRKLTEEIQAMVPGIQVSIVIDHNYSE